MSVDVAIASIATRQHSLILREQALACGMTDRMIRHRCKKAARRRIESCEIAVQTQFGPPILPRSGSLKARSAPKSRHN